MRSVRIVNGEVGKFFRYLQTQSTACMEMQNIVFSHDKVASADWMILFWYENLC